MADGANVGTMQQAGSLISLGLSWREASVAIAIGNLLAGAAVALNGIWGSKCHIPMSIASRASLGFYFSYFAVFSRFVLGLIYFGINTYIGSSCMLIMLEAIWPSLKTYHNAIPTSAGIASNKMIAYFVFWTLQFPLVMIHPSKLRYLFLVKSVCATIAAFSLLGWAVKTGGTGPVFSQTSSIHGSTKSWAYLYGVNVVVSSRTTLALNISDLTRYGRKASATYWQALYIPITYWVFSFIGIVVASSSQAIYGTLSWDPTTVVARWENRAAAFFCAAAFGLATLGTNISTNSVAASNDLAFMVPRWINLRRGSFIVSIIGGWATVAWKIQASATTLTTFLSGYAIVLAPILAVMICDYYIIHRGRFNVPMLYQNEGIYRYHGGFNWRAIVAIFVAVPVNLPGLIHAINTKVPIGNHAYFYKASWLTAMTISGSIYTILSLAFPPKDTFVEVSAYEESETWDTKGADGPEMDNVVRTTQIA